MIKPLIGITGLLFIALSWIPQIIQTIKTKKSGISLKFGLSQFIGGLFIIIYSYLINQILFLILNITVLILVTINLIYAFKERKNE